MRLRVFFTSLGFSYSLKNKGDSADILKIAFLNIYQQSESPIETIFREISPPSFLLVVCCLLISLYKDTSISETLYSLFIVR